MQPARPQYPFPTAALGGGPPQTEHGKAISTEKAQQEEWMAVFFTLFGGAGSALYPARAERLHAYGWSPQDLLDACLQPMWKKSFDPRDAHEFSTEKAEAWSALVQEMVLYHDGALSRATYKRLQLISNLSDAGWSHAEIGQHFGLTKQRIQKLLKEFSRDPGLRAT